MAHSSPNPRPFVVLIHGLHQTGWIMMLMAKEFKKKGFETHLHNYHSLRDSIDLHSDSLNNWLMDNHNPEIPINLVGHSLGGLVIRNFIARFPQWKIGRCVTLGTPHGGSVTANYAKKLAAPLIGNAFENALDGQTAPLNEEISLGVIAGNSPYGLGQLILNYHKQKSTLPDDKGEHDGSVYVYETYLPAAKDHIVLPVSHTGMLVNKQVAQQVIYFLNHGKFKRD